VFVSIGLHWEMTFLVHIPIGSYHLLLLIVVRRVGQHNFDQHEEYS
jgi:hypothetical protein